MKRSLLWPLVIVTALGSSFVRAASLNFMFETLIDVSSVGGVSAETLILDMAIDSETLEQAISIGDPLLGLYNGTLSVSLGAETATGIGQVIVENDRITGPPARDRFAVFASSSFTGFGGSLLGLPVTLATFDFTNSDTTPFTSDALPLSVSPADFDLVGTGLVLDGTPLFPYNNTPIGDATFVFTSSVPLPPAMVFLGSGLAALIFRRRVS